MRLGRPAADLFALKYQTKHFLSCEVSIKQKTAEKWRGGRIRFGGIKEGERKKYGQEKLRKAKVHDVDGSL